MDKYAVLGRYFGHNRFRQGQEELIDAILAGRDALGVMPTGGGKSLCYQIPALLLPGVTVVVSPLISLMKDQVSALREAGIAGAFLNSSLSSDEIRDVYSGVRRGEYKLLYIAPERLAAAGFSALMREVSVSFVAVDEAHCISQWGQDFRPSYLKIAGFIESLPVRPPVAAFTATATGEVQADIVRLLELREPLRVVTGFDRANLFFDVRRPKNKMKLLSQLLYEREGKSGIVYCSTRAHVERVCQKLCQEGIPATRYHAGLEEEERRINQEDFQFDRRTVMVATNAFGMGIDKSNVSFVIHYNMPKSLEAYYQEAGRAGRDGEAADCILLYSPGDVQTARFLIENGGNGELSGEERAQCREQDTERLRAMERYCQTAGCLRGVILEYFGQQHEKSCGNCGNCLGEYQQQDITIPAQMILSCIVRVRDKLGYHVGRSLIMSVLRGKGDRVVQLGLDGLSTYGLMERLSRSQIRVFLDFLEQEGYLWTNPAHKTLELSGDAAAVLFRGKKVLMPVRVENDLSAGASEGRAERTRRDRASRRNRIQRTEQMGSRFVGPEKGETPSSGDEELFSALRALRTQIAQKEGVPVYIVFSNATLSDMAARRPHSREELLEVSGVGQVKADKYGELFLQAIARYESVRPQEDF